MISANHTEDAREKFRAMADQNNLTEDEIECCMINIDLTSWIDEALSDTGEVKLIKKYETPMMKEINYHIKCTKIVDTFTKINVAMNISQQTKDRRKRGTMQKNVDLLAKCTLGDHLKFPGALLNRGVREGLQKYEGGLILNPIILSEKPWPQLRDNMR